MVCEWSYTLLNRARARISVGNSRADGFVRFFPHYSNFEGFGRPPHTPFRVPCDRRPFLPPCEIFFTFRARLVSSPFAPSQDGTQETARRFHPPWNSMQHPIIATLFRPTLPSERRVLGPSSARRKRVRETNALLAPFLLFSYKSKRNRHECMCNPQRPGTT